MDGCRLTSRLSGDDISGDDLCPRSSNVNKAALDVVRLTDVDAIPAGGRVGLYRRPASVLVRRLLDSA